MGGFRFECQASWKETVHLFKAQPLLSLSKFRLTAEENEAWALHVVDIPTFVGYDDDMMFAERIDASNRVFKRVLGKKG